MLTFALLPTITQLLKTLDSTRLIKLISINLKYLAIASLYIAIFFVFYSKDILLVLYETIYPDAIVSLQILSIAMIFQLLSIPLYVYIYAQKRDSKLILRLLLVTILNILSNLILIPRYHIIGSAISMLITELFSFVLFLSMSKLKPDISWLFRTACINVLLISFFIFYHPPLFITLTTSSIVYICTLLCIKVIRLDEFLTIQWEKLM
jgi:O-antigen/teichoic acid export membrane protein